MMTCLPAFCAYCKHYGYVSETPSGNVSRSLYTCKHPDSKCFGMMHSGSKPLCELVIPDHPFRVGKFLYNMHGKKQKQKKFVVPCMKKGSWYTRLIDFQHAYSKEESWDVHFVGVFNTAQEAYVRAGKFIKEWPVAFRGGTLPTHLIIELIKQGEYPDNVEEQFLLPYLQGREVPYMDTKSIMLPERVIERQDVLKTLIDIKVSGNKVSWKLK